MALSALGVAFAIVRDSQLLIAVDANGRRIGMAPLAAIFHVKALAPSGTGLGVLILDPIGGTVSEVQFSKGVGQRTRQWQVPDAAVSTCAIKDQLFVFAPGERAPVIRFNAQATVPVRMGLPLGSFDPRTQAVLARGWILCDPKSDLVLTVSAILGTVMAYRSAGPSAWLVQVPGFRAAEVTASGGSVRIAARPPGVVDRVVGATLLGPSVVAVQVVTAGSGILDVRPVTHFFKASNGDALGSQKGLPYLVAAGGRAVIGLPVGGSPTGYEYSIRHLP
ncbi:MAG: hypothetical protein ACKVZ0_12320 [Gemmatimonadales bacterium]